MSNHYMIISPTFAQKKALLNTALWLSKLVSPFQTLIMKKSAKIDDFKAGELCMELAAKNFYKRRFIFLSEKHSFTGGAIQVIKKRFPELPLKLLLLDAHLDIFNHQESVSKQKNPKINEGNFLAYLLKQSILKEEEIFFFSTNSSINFELPAGYYYLSWDIDYGLSRFARYPYPSPENQKSEKVKSHLKFLFRELSKKDKMVIAMDIVELDYQKVSTPLQVACLMSYFVKYLFLFTGKGG